MNEVRSLIQFVSRNFYPKLYILVLDAILTHSVLSEDDLAYLVGIHRKELRAICNKLVEDRLLVVHAQREEEGTQQRYKTKTYYYIHFTEAIDSVKWKIHTIVKDLKDEIKKDSNPEGYVCRRCGSKYSQIDALALLSPDKSKFICDHCGDELIEDDSGVQLKLREQKLHKLMAQINPIIDYLRKIDKMTIEENTFESSLTRAIPAQSETNASYSLSNKTVRNTANNFAGVYNQQSKQYNTNNTNAILNVKISNEEDELLDEQANLKHKHEKLVQNALPSWHSGSTVGKSSLGRLDDDENDVMSVKDENDEDPDTPLTINGDSDSFKSLKPQTLREETPLSDAGFKIDDKEAEDALAAYYANLEKQQEDEDDEEEEEEEDDEEFEDVMDEDIPEPLQSNDVKITDEVEEFDGESDED